MEYQDDGLAWNEESDLSFSKVELVFSSPNPDIAIIKATVDVVDGLDLPVPLKISSDCNEAPLQTLYGIGFPDISLRNQSETQIFKRWSKGIATEFLFSNQFGNGRNEFLASTVDGLPGSSGGPVINERGEILNIMKASGSVEQNNYIYTGNEATGSLDWQMLGVRCNLLKSTERYFR